MAAVRPVTAVIGLAATFGVIAAVLPASATDTPEDPAPVGDARVAAAGLPPVAVDDVADATQGSFVRIPVLANDSDPEGDELVLQEIVSDPAHGNAQIRNNRIRYLPDSSYVGADALTYRISDGDSTADANIDITVAVDPNQAPVATADSAMTKWQTAIRINVLKNDNDPDSDALLVTDKTRPTHGRVEIVSDGAALRYTPTGEYVGDATFDYTVSDGRGKSDTETVTVNVRPLYAVSLTGPSRAAGLRTTTIKGKVTSRMGGPVLVQVQKRTDKGGWTLLRQTRVGSDDRFGIRWAAGQPGREQLRALAFWDDGRRDTSPRMRLRVVPKFDPVVSKITRKDVPRTWRPGCPVHPSSLRKIRMNFWDYNKKLQRGTLIGASWATADYIYVFRRAFATKFQIKKMYPVDRYGGVDERAMRAGNTSAFNCRHVTGNPYRMSRHSWGDAIDINTFENPYVTGSRVYPAAAAVPYYYRRSHNLRDPGVITGNSSIARALFSRHWYWGARWSNPDYQHWSRTGA